MVFVNDPQIHGFISYILAGGFLYVFRSDIIASDNKSGMFKLRAFLMFAAQLIFLAAAGVYVNTNSQYSDQNRLGYRLNMFVYMNFAATTVLLNISNCYQLMATPVDEVRDVGTLKGKGSVVKRALVDIMTMKSESLPQILVMLSTVYLAGYQIAAGTILDHAPFFVSKTDVKAQLESWEIVSITTIVVAGAATLLIMWGSTTENLVHYSQDMKVFQKQMGRNERKKHWFKWFDVPIYQMTIFNIPAFFIYAFSMVQFVFSTVLYNDTGRVMMYNLLTNIFPHMMCATLGTYGVWFESFLVGTHIHAISHFFYPATFVMTPGAVEAFDAFTGNTTATRQYSFWLDDAHTDMLFRSNFGDADKNNLATAQLFSCSIGLIVGSAVLLAKVLPEIFNPTEHPVAIEIFEGEAAEDARHAYNAVADGTQKIADAITGEDP